MSGPTPLLHHYWLSPFSEKMRLMFGHCDIAWGSVEHSMRLPRPELMLLTGGYRKMPVMQQGADIYCDTRLMSTQLMAWSGRDDLLPEARRQEVQELSDFADSRLFFVVITASMGGSALRALRREHGATWGELLRVVWDRVGMMRGAEVPRIPPKVARRELHAFLQRFEQELEGPFRFGDGPTLADFSVYHVLRFGHETLRADFLRHYPRLLDWMARMAAIGHGRYHDVPIRDALEEAAVHSPAEPGPLVAPPSDCEIGDAVTIRPADYGTIPTQGILIGAPAGSWVLRREVEGLGALHVHFPRQGYRLLPA